MEGRWIDVFVSSRDAPGCEFDKSPAVVAGGSDGPSESQKWTELKVDLDHGVKEVREIKLVGYSSLVGLAQLNDNITVWENDFLVLRIKEIPGQVISNNIHANGAYAILQIAMDGINPPSVNEHVRHEYHPEGIATQTLEGSHSTLRNLTLEVVGSKGEAMKISRLNLWFKLLVTRG